MAVSQPGGPIGPPQKANTGGTVADRSEKGYGSSNAGFGLKSGGMDGVLGPKKQVNQGRGKMPVTPTSDIGQKKGVKGR